MLLVSLLESSDEPIVRHLSNDLLEQPVFALQDLSSDLSLNVADFEPEIDSGRYAIILLDETSEIEPGFFNFSLVFGAPSQVSLFVLDGDVVIEATRIGVTFF
ncbi:MAG: hypothetical protein Gyms2KO_40940 [Gymnodinialimonas sp.]